MGRTNENSGDRAELDAPIYHGYAPDEQAVEREYRPPLTVAISRETGSRGRSVARRVAELLNWQFVDQETLEYVSHDPNFRERGEEPMPDQLREWVDGVLAGVRDELVLDHQPKILPLVRKILELAAEGHAVILGRGAGSVLPAATTLRVSLVAPERERIAYIAQIERMSFAEAGKLVHQRDKARRRFLRREFGTSSSSPIPYDLILNTTEFGVEGCAAVIASAVREKDFHRSSRKQSFPAPER